MPEPLSVESVDGLDVALERIAPTLAVTIRTRTQTDERTKTELSTMARWTLGARARTNFLGTAAREANRVIPSGRSTLKSGRVLGWSSRATGNDRWCPFLRLCPRPESLLPVSARRTRAPNGAPR